MPTFVSVFIFISREYFNLSHVEHEKSFISCGPGPLDSGVSKQNHWLLKNVPMEGKSLNDINLHILSMLTLFMMNKLRCHTDRALTRISKTGVQDSHLAKSRSPTGKSRGVPSRKVGVPQIHAFHSEW